VSYKRKQSQVHKDLGTPKYRQRVVPRKTGYKRKPKHPLQGE